MNALKNSILMVAAAAIVAVVGVGSASATTLCKENKTTGCLSHDGTGTTLDLTLSGTGQIHSGTITLDTCTGSTIKGKTTTTGSDTSGSTEGANAKGSIESLTWTSCTVPTATVATGTLEVTHKAGTDEGTVTGSGSEVTFLTGPFGHCIYGTANTDLGVLKGSSSATSDATIIINATLPIKHNISGLCPTTATWTATYNVTEPTPLYISD